jgi:hypothetical protein
MKELDRYLATFSATTLISNSTPATTRPPNSRPPFCLRPITTKLIPSKTQSQAAYLSSLQRPSKRSKAALPTSVSCETTSIPSHSITTLSNTFPRSVATIRTANDRQSRPFTIIFHHELRNSKTDMTLSASSDPPTSTPITSRYRPSLRNRHRRRDLRTARGPSKRHTVHPRRNPLWPELR